MKLTKMAWRNVWRNRRRSLVTVAAMTLGLLTMMLAAGMMEGFLRDMEASVLDLEVGDLQVFAEDYRTKPSIYTRIEDPDALLGPLDSAGLVASARLLGFGLAASGDASAGISLRGLDVERDARVSLLPNELDRGTWLEPGDMRGVVIGRRLSRALGVEPGGELLVLSQGADGSMAYDLYTVRGVLRGVGDATDRTGVFMTEPAFRELMTVPDGAHQIIVRRGDMELAAAASKVASLGSELDVQTWRQLMPTVSTYIDSARSMIVVLFLIVYLAIAILILNAMLMAVFERIREIGVLKALGVGPFQVIRLVLLETGIQTALAVGIGLLLGTPALLYLTRTGVDIGSLAGVAIMGVSMNTVWRAAITPEVFTSPVFTLVAIVFLAVVYPAVKAAAIEPVAAIHHH